MSSQITVVALSFSNWACNPKNLEFPDCSSSPIALQQDLPPKISLHHYGCQFRPTLPSRPTRCPARISTTSHSFSSKKNKVSNTLVAEKGTLTKGSGAKVAPLPCENHVRGLRTFFTVVLEPNIYTFSVLSETLPDFLKSKLCSSLSFAKLSKLSSKHGATQSKTKPKLVLFKANTVAVYSRQKQTKQRNTRSALPNSIIKEICTY